LGDNLSDVTEKAQLSLRVENETVTGLDLRIFAAPSTV
jgi:hypothetical protein